MVVVACLMTGCTVGPFEEESSGGLKFTAEQMTHFDGYCGVGVKIENGSNRTAKFVEDDIEVFDGSSSLEWNLPFPDVKTGDSVRGYVVDEFPTTIDPGAVATHAFVMNCDGNPYTLTVNSINAGSVSFNF
ncbi:hypothetical protein [Cryobacterium sp. TMT3-29-2]|uniref:hypothetical protein n=1 Tax=Cryobacterium sp. TMT3-29-2 TaxID=2555867 RepID=UPI00107449E8|nr:hypothetical protein [Cryobacterium sp. TMT3-29-2]TFC91941.1 hypothetical protein E3O67_04020 [Cryobacterium sp. TMT3-29-2]